MTTLKPEEASFVESVLALNPRIATFDCDGTLWSGDAGEGFFSWELKRGLVSEEIQQWAPKRYAAYRAGNVPEDVMCGEMATMHHGMREEVVQQAADEFFKTGIAPNIFPEMRELVTKLLKSGCDVWAVSSSNHWVIRSGMRYFGIPADRILSAEAAVQNGIVLNRLVRLPSGPGKAEAIHAMVRAVPDCAFGNAIWDREMLALAKHAFAINPNPNLRDIAIEEGWRVYQPQLNQPEHGK